MFLFFLLLSLHINVCIMVLFDTLFILSKNTYYMAIYFDNVNCIHVLQIENNALNSLINSIVIIPFASTPVCCCLLFCLFLRSFMTVLLCMFCTELNYTLHFCLVFVCKDCCAGDQEEPF